MIQKPTITIGIPAHNEAKNIGKLLGKIFKQVQDNYILESIIVACDGSTDATASIVKRYAKKHRKIHLINDRKRLGKAKRLNMIYAKSQSDFLLSFDADVLPDRNNEIHLMVEAMQKNPDAQVVGGRYIPIKPDTIMGKFAYVSYLSFEDAVLKLHNGNNYYALMGCASLIRKSLYKSFTYPKGTISDQCYLYAMATQNNRNGFKLARNTRILFMPVATFRDWRLLGVRSVSGDKESIVSFIGKEVLKDYYMPRHLFVISLVKWFFKSPIYTSGSVLMNLYIRFFPYSEYIPQEGIWAATETSKHIAVG